MLVSLNLLTFTLGDFRRWRNHQDIANLALVQTLGFQHQFQCLIPGHILQAQGNTPCHRIAGHQIQLCEISNELQYRTHFDVLEVQRYPVTHIAKFVFTALHFFSGERLNADDVFVIRLVGEVIKIASGF